MIWKRRWTEAQVINSVRRFERNRSWIVASLIGGGMLSLGIGTCAAIHFQNSWHELASLLAGPPELPQPSLSVEAADAGFRLGLKLGFSCGMMVVTGGWSLACGIGMAIAPDRRNSMLLEFWNRSNPQAANNTSP